MLVGTTRTRKRPPTTELYGQGKHYHSCPTLHVNEVAICSHEVGHQKVSFASTRMNLNVFSLGLVSVDGQGLFTLRKPSHVVSSEVFISEATALPTN